MSYNQAEYSRRTYVKVKKSDNFLGENTRKKFIELSPYFLAENPSGDPENFVCGVIWDPCLLHNGPDITETFIAVISPHSRFRPVASPSPFQSSLLASCIGAIQILTVQ